MKFDVAIIGAGPVGLSLASALAASGMTIVVLERQAETALSEPAFDGREIALTHHSVELMHKLGLWERIDPNAISALRDAKVLNGSSLQSLDINHRDSKKSELGHLISNHIIRKAAYDTAITFPAITLKNNTRVTDIQTSTNSVAITLADGETIEAKLLVGADSRFSETRRMMGIAADMHDFGKTMMVCVMQHETAHQHIAWEWFDYGQTLALLPMNGMQSSVVVTLSPQEIDELMQMSEDDFSQVMSARFMHRLGTMRLISTRHAYPLVTVYAKRMVGQRFALAGDAAVGMHPVTAHGFNFGLKGVATLSAAIKNAHEAGQDIGATGLLLRYEQTHRRHTRPLYLATHAIAKLYGSETPPARLLRTAILRVGNRITPFKRAVAGFLSDSN